LLLFLLVAMVCIGMTKKDLESPDKV